MYYPNKNKKEEYDFSNGKKDGYYTSYYKNGALKSDLEYNKGKLSGSCSWYYPSGNLMKIQEFLNREDESFCSMCPANRDVYTKPDPTLPVTYYERLHERV